MSTRRYDQRDAFFAGLARAAQPFAALEPLKSLSPTRTYPLGKQASAKPLQFPDAPKVYANTLEPFQSSAFGMLAHFLQRESNIEKMRHPLPAKALATPVVSA